MKDRIKFKAARYYEANSLENFDARSSAKVHRYLFYSAAKLRVTLCATYDPAKSPRLGLPRQKWQSTGGNTFVKLVKSGSARASSFGGKDRWFPSPRILWRRDSNEQPTFFAISSLARITLFAQPSTEERPSVLMHFLCLQMANENTILCLRRLRV